MWLLPPFLEAGAGLEEALLHYATQVDIIYTISTVSNTYLLHPATVRPRLLRHAARAQPAPGHRRAGQDHQEGLHHGVPQCRHHQVGSLEVRVDRYDLVPCCSPLTAIPRPAELRTWHKRVARHEARIKEGRDSKPPPLPPQHEVFSRYNRLNNPLK